MEMCFFRRKLRKDAKISNFENSERTLYSKSMSMPLNSFGSQCSFDLMVRWQTFSSAPLTVKNMEINQKSEKTFPRYMFLDGFGKFLVVLVQKYFFLPMLKKIIFIFISN